MTVVELCAFSGPSLDPTQSFTALSLLTDRSGQESKLALRMSAKVKPYVCLKGAETRELSDHCSSCLAHPPLSLFCSINTHPGTKQTVTSDHPAKASHQNQTGSFPGRLKSPAAAFKTTRLCRHECEAHTQHVAGSKPVDCYATLLEP